jgi:ATP-dependent Clp protease ATP-binding subunit ClpA
MFEKFTERARKAISLSRQEAQRLRSPFIDTEHLLLGILEEGNGVAVKVLNELRLDPSTVRGEIEKHLTPSSAEEVPRGQHPFSPGSKRTIELAAESAKALGQLVIGTEHLLLGLLRDEGIAGTVLVGLGLEEESVRAKVLEVLEMDLSPPPAAPREDSLDERRLFDRAQAYLALEDRPAILDQLVSLLQSGKSIALVGPRAVGKTSLVFALSRAKAGGLDYRSIDYRIFDEFFSAKRPDPRSPGTVRFVPEGELVTASRSPVADLLDERRREGERLIVEFREAGFDAYAARFPDLAKTLTPIPVAAPDTAECRQLLESARLRLRISTHLAIPDSVLAEADRLARARWQKLVAPWPTLIALWKAAMIQNESGGRGDLQRLMQDIEQLQKSTKPEDALTVAALRLHADGLRGLGAELTIESVRQAIGELADRPSLL